MQGDWLNNKISWKLEDTDVDGLEWPDISTTYVNEYNTKGFLDMALPTLFSIGDFDWLHRHICNIEIHEYGLHLLRYCDQRFGIHLIF